MDKPEPYSQAERMVDKRRFNQCLKFVKENIEKDSTFKGKYYVEKAIAYVTLPKMKEFKAYFLSVEKRGKIIHPAKGKSITQQPFQSLIGAYYYENEFSPQSHPEINRKIILACQKLINSQKMKLPKPEGYVYRFHLEKKDLI